MASSKVGEVGCWALHAAYKASRQRSPLPPAAAHNLKRHHHWMNRPG